MLNRNTVRGIVLTAILTMLMAVGVQAQDSVTIEYVLWDTNQLPHYQTCADNFMAENEGITIEIEQLGWDDYWTAITTGFISGDAPDVFTNHLAKYPEFESEIRAYYGRWTEMLDGAKQGTVDLLTQIHEEKKYRLCHFHLERIH